MQAPHIIFRIVPPGIYLGLHSGMCFPDDDTAANPVLSRIERQGMVTTVVAERTGAGRYRFDIHLQGPQETIFFDS